MLPSNCLRKLCFSGLGPKAFDSSGCLLNWKNNARWDSCRTCQPFHSKARPHAAAQRVDSKCSKCASQLAWDLQLQHPQAARRIGPQLALVDEILHYVKDQSGLYMKQHTICRVFHVPHTSHRLPEREQNTSTTWQQTDYPHGCLKRHQTLYSRITTKVTENRNTHPKHRSGDCAENLWWRVNRIRRASEVLWRKTGPIAAEVYQQGLCCDGGFIKQ